MKKSYCFHVLDGKNKIKGIVIGPLIRVV